MLAHDVTNATKPLDDAHSLRHSIKSNQRPAKGDIRPIKESIFTPLAQLFHKTVHLTADTPERHSLSASTSTFLYDHGSKDDPRPCIVDEYIRNSDCWMVYLMGTMNGGDIRTGYPSAMTHFSAEVDPETPVNDDYIRVSPRWNKTAWVITYAMKTKSGLSEEQGHIQHQRWTSPRKGGHEFVLERAEQRKLSLIAARHRKTWQALACDAQTMANHQKEFDEALKKKNWRIALRNDSSDVLSIATRRTGASSKLRNVMAQADVSVPRTSSHLASSAQNSDNYGYSSGGSDAESSALPSPEASYQELHDNAGVVSAEPEVADGDVPSYDPSPMSKRDLRKAGSTRSTYSIWKESSAARVNTPVLNGSVKSRK